MIGVDHAERPAPQRITHPLGPVADQLHGVGHRAVERGLGERQRIELEVGAQHRHQVAQHRAPHHAGEDLQRALARLRLATPTAIQHGEARLVARSERHAVE